MGNKWELFGIYIAALTALSFFWQNSRDTHKTIGDLRERMARVEVRLDRGEVLVEEKT